MLGPAPFLLCVVTVAASQVSTIMISMKRMVGMTMFMMMMSMTMMMMMTMMMQGLTAKQWAEKGTVGRFGGVVLSPSYRHVRLYLYLYLCLYFLLLVYTLDSIFWYFLHWGPGDEYIGYFGRKNYLN